MEVIDEYSGADVKMLHRCKKCGYERLISPHSLFQTKYGCPKCASKILGNNNKFTHEEFLSRLKEINPNIEILSKYMSTSEKIRCRCLIDGYEWETTPSKLIHAKHGCPKCGGSLKLTHEDFLERVKKYNLNITVLGKYKNDKTKVKVKCNICDHIWEISPTHLYRGRGCPECAIKKRHDIFVKSQDQFEKELFNIDPNIEIIGSYYNSHTKIQCKCKVCGNIWYSLPSNLLKMRGCPECTSSKGERMISHWLNKNKIFYITEKTFDDCIFIKPLRFDFYLPFLNICIEFDGIQHFKPTNFGSRDVDQEILDKEFEMCKLRDAIKTKYCQENNIKLIRIPYWEYENINDILEKHIL